MSTDTVKTTKLSLGGEWGMKVEIQALHLKVTEGPDKGLQNTFLLPLIRIGTDEANDVVLTDGAISGHHAQITLEDDGPTLKDLDSTNGVKINGVRVKECLIEPGQVLELGETRLAVEPRTEERVAVLGDEEGLGALVGRSRAMRELYGMLEAIGPTPATVMIQGESGTGKELVAQTLHELSGREGPLVVFDAATTAPELMQSDLFGHVKGAFTGAADARDGAFRTAHKGTLFLDEVGELPLDLQPRLLRVLESREVSPVGSDTRHRVDVRVVTATHRDLEAMVAAGEFREDLYHRLSVIQVDVPPLRQRTEDLDLLVPRLVERLGMPAPDLTEEARQAMAAYSWPGNVRELRNVLERVSALCAGRPVTPADLKLEVPKAPPAGPGAAGGGTATMEDLEREAILAALERNGGSRSDTAKELGISTTTLWRRLKSYGITD